MNLTDVLDVHGEKFDKATHGGIKILKAAIRIFVKMTRGLKPKNASSKTVCAL